MHLLSSAALIVGTPSIHPIPSADSVPHVFHSLMGDNSHLLHGLLRLLLCNTKVSFQLISSIASSGNIVFSWIRRKPCPRRDWHSFCNLDLASYSTHWSFAYSPHQSKAGVPSILKESMEKNARIMT